MLPLASPVNKHVACFETFTLCRLRHPCPAVSRPSLSSAAAFQAKRPGGCPFCCDADVPYKATRCKHCCAELPPLSAAQLDALPSDELAEDEMVS